MLGWRQQPGLLLLERFGHRQIVATRPTPLMRDLIAPQPGLSVALGQSGEHAAGPERVPHITNGAFYSTFLIAGAYLARPGSAVVVRAEFKEARMEVDVFAAALQDNTLEVLCAATCNVEWRAQMPIGRGPAPGFTPHNEGSAGYNPSSQRITSRLSSRILLNPPPASTGGVQAANAFRFISRSIST